LGFGFDLGFTYYPKKTFKLQPVFDGYIKHSNKSRLGLIKDFINTKGLILFLMTAMTLGTYIRI
jgi:hypothetical protein